MDAGEADLHDALRVQNEQLGITFGTPDAPRLTRAALAAGAQTRGGERNLEALLGGLR